MISDDGEKGEGDEKRCKSGRKKGYGGEYIKVERWRDVGDVKE